MLPYIWIGISSGSFLELLIWSCPVQLVPLTCNLQYASSMNRMWMVILRPSIYWLCMAGSEPDSCRGGELPRAVWGWSCLGGLYNHLPFGPRVAVWAPRLHIPCPVYGRDGYIAIISILHREQGKGTDIIFNRMFIFYDFLTTYRNIKITIKSCSLLFLIFNHVAHYLINAIRDTFKIVQKTLTSTCTSVYGCCGIQQKESLIWVTWVKLKIVVSRSMWCIYNSETCEAFAGGCCILGERTKSKETEQPCLLCTTCTDAAWS